MMKTSELTGTALDWAVAKCEGRLYEQHGWTATKIFRASRCAGENRFSTHWAQGGSIIERERININDFGGEGWEADDSLGRYGYGSTPLIAAMRCYVASKLGDEVDVPEELL